MPNQPAAGKKVTTVLLPETLLDKLGKLAEQEDRSRNKIIEMILEEQAGEYLKNKQGPKPSKG